MNTEHLRAFCAAVKTGSISRAAESLHLTQPALSQEIRALESQFGVELLRRTHRGVETTPAGDALYDYGQRILALTRGLNEEMTRISGNAAKRLSVGASTGIGGYALPCSIYLFKEKYPDADVSLVVANTEEILRQLEDRQLQVGVVEGPVTPGPNLVAQTLSEDELVLVAPQDGIWAGRQEVTLDELKRYPLLVREDGSGTRHSLEEALKAMGMHLKDFNVVMEMNSLDAIKASVEAGRGVSLVCRLAIRKELRHGGLKTVSVKGATFPSRYTLLYQRSSRKTQLETRFIRFLKCPRERGFC